MNQHDHSSGQQSNDEQLPQNAKSTQHRAALLQTPVPWTLAP